MHNKKEVGQVDVTKWNVLYIFNTNRSQFVKPNIVYVFTYVQSWCIYLICYFIVPSKLLQTN